MGILGDLKEKVSGGSSDDKPSFEDEFQDEPEDDGFEDEEVSEPEPEWDTAYQFGNDVVQQIGFVDMKEFIDKAMVHRIGKSPMYRDRIESGVRTMNMISSSMSDIHDMQSRFKGDKDGKDYEEYVSEVRAANDLIDELDRMEGKEEQIANEVIGIARDAVDAMGQGKQVSEKSVDSSVGIVNEDE